MTGQTLSHYRILDKLGEGGMGVVYKAEDTKLRRTVALKFLPPHATEHHERFLREAQSAASLNHPNICTIHEIDDEHHFIAMEFIEGSSVKEKIETRPLPLDEAIDIAIQACTGLQAAHEKGIVHRDIKPANLMLTAQGQVKIMDFGLAQVGDRTRLTKAGASMGTPAYMSPEQVRGDATDRRTDLWAAGVMLYEAISGQLPFRGDSNEALSYNILHSDPQPLTALRSGLPLELDRIVAKALRKDPRERYQNAEDLMVDLRHLSGRPADAAAGKRRRWIPVAVAAGIAVLALAAILWQQWTKPFVPPSPAQFVQLTEFTDSAVQPSLSADGRMLAFIRGSGSNSFVSSGQVYVKLLPNGDAVQLTRDGLTKVDPVFSPDGVRVVYTVSRNAVWDSWSVPVLGGEPKLWLPNASGLRWIGPQRLIFSEIKGSGIHMASVTATESRTEARDIYVPKHERGMVHRSYLSPDGKWVLLAEMDNAGWLRCRLSPFDGSSPGNPSGPPGRCLHAAWSPDGRWMYFASDATGTSQIWRQRFPNGTPQQLTLGPSEAAGIAMAPDGKSLITSIGIDQSSIWIHDTGGERQLTSQNFATLPAWGDGLGQNIFSPDGKKAYYLVRKGTSRGFNAGELWEADRESGKTETVLPGISLTSFDISADGKRLTYSSVGPDGMTSVWLASLQRAFSPRQLSHQEATGPVFGADGKVFYRGSEGARNYIYAVNEQGGEPVKAFPEPAVNAPTTSPDGRWVVATMSTQGESPGKVVAWPSAGGAAITLCDWCRLMWPRDGKHLLLSLRTDNDNTGDQTFVIPLPDGKMFPDLKGRIIRSRDDVTQIPGVRIIRQNNVFPSTSAFTYAFAKRVVQRNLYRIPLE